MELPAVEVSQTPEDKFREFLASGPKPQRFTDQQREMVQFIFSRHNHFDADQLIDELKQTKSQVSRATVYRTLKKLVEARLLREIDVGPRKVYEHDYGYPDHDHMVCESCEKMIEFRNPSMQALIREVCAENQFQAKGHNFVIRGICVECNQARVRRRRLDLV